MGLVDRHSFSQNRRLLCSLGPVRFGDSSQPGPQARKLPGRSRSNISHSHPFSCSRRSSPLSQVLPSAAVGWETVSRAQRAVSAHVDSGTMCSVAKPLP